MDKRSLLFRSGQILFHTQDLALLWGMQNRHNLRVTISRYIKKGLLYSITRGLYSVVPVGKLDRLLLGSALIHRFSYLSCESILENYGVINRKVFSLTYVSSISRKIEINGVLCVYRQMATKFLLNPEGIFLENGVYKASLERAVADCQYFNPNFYFDSPELINFSKVNKIKRKVGY